MRAAFRISLLAIGLASLLGSGGAWAGALVEFPNVSERGPPTLVGYLAARSGSGRNPRRAAGFVALRFGVDTFSANALHLQNKSFAAPGRKGRRVVARYAVQSFSGI